MDVDLPIDYGYDLPDADTVLPPGAEGQQTSPEAVALDASLSTMAPLRRRVRIPRIIPLDTTIELTARDVKEWTENYLTNMAEKNAASSRGRAPALAKRNAYEWTLGGGIASIASGTQPSVTTPLDIFHGALLYEAITGIPWYPSGVKRSLDDADDEALDVERQVRPRTGDKEQTGHGMVVDPMDDGILLPGDEVEMPRETVEGLEDISSAMPWNITTSIRGSSAARQRLGSVSGLPFSQLRESIAGSRGQRLVSASPLSGRGGPTGLHSAAMEHFEGFTSDQGFAGDLGVSTFVGRDDFEIHDPAEEVDTLMATQPSWEKGILDPESSNFRDFLRHAIEERRDQIDQSGASPTRIDSISFEDLLNPATNSTVVAAHALLHVLSLVSKNIVSATQTEAYGPIELKIVDFSAQT